MTQEQHLGAGLFVFLIETSVHLYRHNHLTDLVYQKYILYTAVGLWIGDCVKVKPDGNCHYEAAKTQTGIHVLVGSAVSHFADRSVYKHGVSFGKFSTILQTLYYIKRRM